MAIGAVRHFQRALATMKFARKPLIALDRHEGGQNLVIRPVAASHLRPCIIILTLTPDVDHRIDRTATADDMTLRHKRQPPVQAFFRLADIDGCIAAFLQNLEKSRRDMDVFVSILLPAFDQQNMIGRHFRQPCCEDATCRPAAHDDIVVTVHSLPPNRPLKTVWPPVRQQKTV